MHVFDIIHAMVSSMALYCRGPPKGFRLAPEGFVTQCINRMLKLDVPKVKSHIAYVSMCA